MSESTELSLPQSIPFPVTVTSVLCRQGEHISKHQPIFKYKYWSYQDDPNSKDENPPKVRVERIGTFESPIEGEVDRINVGVNSEVAHSGIELCSIKEPCNHAVQYGGLCALCGKSLEDEKDYSGYDYEDRATIAMSHDNAGIKISLDEATKIESSSTDRLLQEKKLILVVDLDQTVIHATVDPTVCEWQLDPTNPNYPAVKGVKSFCLEEEPILPSGWEGPKLPPTKCWYYVKLRPGLEEFLQLMSQLYEMHIYTMATRSYALEIAKLIDPDGTYFGDRILSRDESGSLTHKNLKRLFPVDRSMVAIIDDRGDVWQWESNLIKVVPYDFFVGIGDINSSFLPKKFGQITGPTKKRKSLAKLEAFESKSAKDAGENNADKTDKNGKSLDLIEGGHATSPVDRLLELGGGEDNANLLIEQSINRTQSLEQQQHERPLAKLQHDLQKINHEHESLVSSDESEMDKAEEDEEEDNLLYDDDNELYSLQTALENVHKKYYELRQENEGDQLYKPDLTKIIPSLKVKCLEGVTILFSGILPLGTNINNADIVIWCKQFGVKVVNDVFPEVTHVVCRDPAANVAKSGFTFKVRMAKKILPDVKIVNPDWLFACLSSWRKVDETNYLIEGSEGDWAVEEQDEKVYLKALEIKKSSRDESGNDGTDLDRRVSIDEYALDQAYQEVDEFLALISDDNEDDDDEDDESDDDEDDDEDEHQNYDDNDDNDNHYDNDHEEKEIDRYDHYNDNDNDNDNDIEYKKFNNHVRISSNQGPLDPNLHSGAASAGGDGTSPPDVIGHRTDPSSNLGRDNGRDNDPTSRDTFIRDVYHQRHPQQHLSSKRLRQDESSAPDQDGFAEPMSKKRKHDPSSDPSSDSYLDELERELLDGFDDLDDDS